MWTPSNNGNARLKRTRPSFLASSLLYMSASSSPLHDKSTSRSSRQSQINLNRPRHPRRQTKLQWNQQSHQYLEIASRILPGAFNPALVAFDPNSPEYVPNDPGKLSQSINSAAVGLSPELAAQAYGAPADWIQCPPEIEGDRASYDCTAYVKCSGGQMQGSFQSCMGLMFDNEKGTCDWADTVTCLSVQQSTSGITYSREIGSATAFRPMSTTGSVDSGKVEGAAWNGGSDWGGSWVEGVWVSDGDLTSPPAEQSSSETAWIDQVWNQSEIKFYPPSPILAVDELDASSNNRESNEVNIPRNFVSEEGWSSGTRKSKTVIGYYASWQWYDNSQRSAPGNMKFQKLDRVNFAFFQTNVKGDIWGTDPWADAVTLFGPNDWLIQPRSEIGYAPQFNDDNGFVDDGENYTYVGSKYVDLGTNVYCHRVTPTGKRDCKGYMGYLGLIERAHSQGAHVYISIGGWSLSDAFPVLAADAKARRNFAKNCVGLIREYRVDGIDVVWTYPGYEPHQGTSSDKKNFVLLLKEIRSALNAYQKVAFPNGEKIFGITAALPCIPPIIDSQDIPEISSILTELNLMTFDFHGTWDDRVGINAPLFDQDNSKFDSPEYSVDACVQRWVGGGANRSSINIGLPFYGRSFGGSKTLFSGHTGPDGIHWWSDEGQPQYYNILEKLPEMISLRDDVTKTQYAYFDDDSGGLISYDDNQATCDKVEYAQKKNLNGYIVWELSGDLTVELATPLLDIINIKLEKGRNFNCSLLQAVSRDENGMVIAQNNSKPDPWYANWETGTCVNDGKQSSWEKEDNLFRFKEECCSYKFQYKFDLCMGPPTYEPSGNPQNSPSSSPVQAKNNVVSANTHTAATHAGVPHAAATHTAATKSVDIHTTVRITKDAPAEGSPEPPVTWCQGGCKGANEKCVGNQNHPQNVDDETCKSCMEGQTFWPCDVDGLCFCWDPAKPRIPPAPASGLAQLSDERPCDYFTEDTYKSLAPDSKLPYTYQGLCDAIDHYNEGHAEKIFMMGTEEERKKEFAAFLGHTLHESDEWKAAREYLICADTKMVGDETYCKPCTTDEFDWETFKCTGVGLAGGGLTFNGYCDSVIQPPAACPCNDTITGDAEGYIRASDVFFGRGAIQLSWNYNFRAASEALTGDPHTFCDDPDLVATVPEYAWGAGVFFWMENLKEETTCHIEALAHHDFGGTLNNINGGLECPAYHGGYHGEAVKLRLNRYCKATSALGLESIMILDGCKGLNTSFAECLGDGSCPDCVKFKDGVETMVSSQPDKNGTKVEGPTDSDIVSASSAPTPVTSSGETHTPSVMNSTLDESATIAEDNSTSSPAYLSQTFSPSLISKAPSALTLNETKSSTPTSSESNTTVSPSGQTSPSSGETQGPSVMTSSVDKADSSTPTLSPSFSSQTSLPTLITEANSSSVGTHTPSALVSDELTSSTPTLIEGNTTASPIYLTQTNMPTSISEAPSPSIGTLAPTGTTSKIDKGKSASPTLAEETTTLSPSYVSQTSLPTLIPKTASPSGETQTPSALTSNQLTTSTFILDEVKTTQFPAYSSQTHLPTSTSEATSSPSQISSESTQAPVKGSTSDAPVVSQSSSPSSEDVSDISSAPVDLATEIQTTLAPTLLSLSGCPEGLIPVENLTGCCLPEPAYLGDGACDPDAPYNTVECNFDNGDCCKETCDLNSTYGCGANSFGYGPFGYFCLNPDLEEYIDPDLCTVSDRTRIGDGRCDAKEEMYNTADCKFDGGDCCEDTCEPRYSYFECGGLDFPYDCKRDEFSHAEDVTTVSIISSESSTSSTSSSSSLTEIEDSLASGTVSLKASDDATIKKNEPDSTNGNESSLQLRGVSFGPNAQDVIIRFMIPASESIPENAVLRLYSLSNSESGGLFHLAPESSPWSEDTVTWNSAPDYVDRLGTLGPIEKDQWYEVDVIDAILTLSGKEGPITFRIRSRNPGYTEYSSKEGDHPPEILISYVSQVAENGPNSSPSTKATSLNAVSIIASDSEESSTLGGDSVHFYPVWGTGGFISCLKGSPPSWAIGAYLKETKADCCQAYFFLKVDECMST